MKQSHPLPRPFTHRKTHPLNTSTQYILSTPSLTPLVGANSAHHTTNESHTANSHNENPQTNPQDNNHQDNNHQDSHHSSSSEQPTQSKEPPFLLHVNEIKSEQQLASLIEYIQGHDILRPYHTIPYYTIPHYTIPYYTTPHHTTPHHTTRRHTPHHALTIINTTLTNFLFHFFFVQMGIWPSSMLTATSACIKKQSNNGMLRLKVLLLTYTLNTDAHQTQYNTTYQHTLSIYPITCQHCNQTVECCV